MKKTLKVFSVITIFIVLIIGVVVTYLFPDLCDNEIIKITTSPDNKYKLILFERNCGATTGFSTQISILKIGNNLEIQPGNIYIAKGYPSNYSISWKSNNSVYISGAKSEAFKKEIKINNIDILYE